MATVIKRGGKKQAFSPAKLTQAVGRAVKEAKIAPTKARELVGSIVNPISELVKAKKIVKAVDIRRSVIGRLDRRAKSVSNAWRRYEKKKKK